MRHKAKLVSSVVQAMSDSNWKSDPASGEWGADGNWESGTVPTGTAYFKTSCRTAITFTTVTPYTVENIHFDEDAAPFEFNFGTASATPALTISGTGVVNNSTSTQSFCVASTGTHYYDPQLKFTGSATAGDQSVSYYAGPDSLYNGYGGGIIGFCDNSRAGSASFTVRTGVVAPPKRGSTVGGEVSFSDNSTASKASFTIYGSLSLTDGDTFGNAVFHDSATADHATFTNVGGTVPNGDGGNTQFYDTSTAAEGVYCNLGATCDKANGGDVAFDGIAKAGTGKFYNHAAIVAGGNGGVTSFNNNENWSNKKLAASNADQGTFTNYGAKGCDKGGGGHTEFTAKYGSPTGARGTFINYGSEVDQASTAGHTIFSVSVSSGDGDGDANYFPTAGNGEFYNHPGVVGGFTEFAVYDDDYDDKDKAKHSSRSSSSPSKVPTAGDGVFHNLGGDGPGIAGGYTSFKNTSTADNATLIGLKGSGGGAGGRILFYDGSTGGTAFVTLEGDDGGEGAAILDISYHTGELSIGKLSVDGGVVKTQVGTYLTKLSLTDELILLSSVVTFSFYGGDGFRTGTAYTLLYAPNLHDYSADQFAGNNVEGATPRFSISDNELQVTFND